MRLLVVEDNDVNRRLLWAVLRNRGHESVEVNNAPDAIAALGGQPVPDLVLLDIEVPGGGLTVARHIKATPELAGVTVIALTALAMRGDRDRFLAAGCHAYIPKPIDVKTFAADIEAIHLARAARP